MAEQLIDYVKFRVSRDCEVAIAFYGSIVTQAAIDKLLQTVELMKDCYAQAEEPKPFDLDSSHPTTEADGVMEGSLPQ